MSALDLVDVQIPWPTALVVVVLLVAPQVGGWISSARAAAASRSAVKTLTTTNGGSHVADQLNRIESGQKANTAAIVRIYQRLDAHDDRLNSISTDTAAIRTQTED